MRQLKLKENDKVRNIADGQIYIVKAVKDNVVLVERESNIHEMIIADVERIEK